MEFGCDLFAYAGLASPAAAATLQKNIINFLHGSPQADGHQGPGSSKPDGTGKAWLRGGRASPPTSFATGAGDILWVASVYICL